MIYAEKYTEVEMELRRIVDEMMRHELDLLQVVYCPVDGLGVEWGIGKIIGKNCLKFCA